MSLEYNFYKNVEMNMIFVREPCIYKWSSIYFFVEAFYDMNNVTFIQCRYIFVFNIYMMLNMVRTCT